MSESEIRCHRTRKPSTGITARIIEACKMLESMGCVGSLVLSRQLAISQSAVSHLMTRSIGAGLVVPSGTTLQRRYTVKFDWCETVARATPDTAIAPEELCIEYAGCPPPGAPPKITGPLAPTVWRGLSHLVPA